MYSKIYWVILLHKYGMLDDINIRCLIDTETNIKSAGFIYNNIQLHLVMAETKDTTLFCELLKKFEGTKTVFP